ncbi:MAG: toll/interleukin-1 receptor domain-containing protein [Saprospiraceae bacterium]|nr:toll/interleukin-1 receptor domain-containing protein [Saprospiraceae bacterium]
MSQDKMHPIYISHAWGGDSDIIVEQLVRRLEQEKLPYILDTRDLNYKQSIKHFMLQLGKADSVILVISNKYLKSEFCMFELVQIYKNENLHDRIFPIVLEEVKISKSSDRLEFVKYWEDQLEELHSKLRELHSLSYLDGITEDLNLYTEIRNNIAKLTGILRDINTLNIRIHKESDFMPLIGAIRQRMGILPSEEQREPVLTGSGPVRKRIRSSHYLFALMIIALGLWAWFIISRTGSTPTTGKLSQSDTSRTSAIQVNPHGVDAGAGSKQSSDTGFQVAEPLQTGHMVTNRKPADHRGNLSGHAIAEPGKVESPVVQNAFSKPEASEPEVKSSTELSKPAPMPGRREPLTAHIPKGTLLYVQSREYLSSEDEAKNPRVVRFALSEPLMSGKEQLLPAGTPVQAVIKSARPSQFKRTGSIELVFSFVEAPDGQRIPLESNDLQLVGERDQPMEIPVGRTIRIKTSKSYDLKY